MKKFIITSLLLSLLYTTTLFASTSIPVYFNDTKLQLSKSPVMKNGNVLIPFRDIFETLGYTISYDGYTQSITGTKDGSIITLYTGSTYANVSGTDKTLTVAPEIVDGTAMVPLRFVSETAGYTVEWHTDNDSQYITIDNYDPSNVAKTSIYRQQEEADKLIEKNAVQNQKQIDAKNKEAQEYQDYLDARDAIYKDYNSKWISKDNLTNLYHIYAMWMGDYITFQEGSSQEEIYRIEGSPKQQLVEGTIYYGNGVHYQYISTITYPFPESRDGSGKLEIKVDSIVFSVPDLKKQGVIK